MTRSDIIRMVFRNKRELLISDIEKLVDLINARIIGALADGKRVELRGFGIFSPKKLARKVAASPRGGQKIELPERTSVKFRAGKSLAEAINPKIDA